MSRRHDVQDATGNIERISGAGIVQQWGRGAPTGGTAGFAPGCLYHNITGTTGSALYVNVGTATSSNWVNLA